MIDKEKLKRKFSRNAKTYDQYAKVQKIMADELIKDIKEAKFENILEIGCGTGYVTKKLRQKFKSASITAVDIASGMIEYAKSNINHEKIKWICEDIETMILHEKYDLIISSATFQWFNHPKETLKKLMSALDEGGKLYFSTFGSDTFWQLHEAFKEGRKKLHIQEEITPGQSFLSTKEWIHLYQEISNQNQWNLHINMYESYEVEHFPSCQEFLYAVKKIGASNSQKQKFKGSSLLLEEAMKIYHEKYREEKGIPATYHHLKGYIQK